jgi:mono/diheme cytochrome c family protein
LPALAQQHGKTIWDGVLTEEQAVRGRKYYGESCASCHKDDLMGADNAPALVGAPFIARWSGSTVDDVVQTIRSSMPQDAPDSLGSAVYVDIVSYLLKTNGSPAGTGELPTDRVALQQIQVTSAPGSR